MEHEAGRRRFLSVATLAGAGLALGSLDASAQGSEKPDKGKAKEADVNPTEDLMREHGVLRRVLLVYEEGLRRLAAGEPAPASVLASAAGIVQRFIEGYHEKTEEEFVFPKMVKAGKQVELTRVLTEQHAAGRKLTAAILKNATPAGLKGKASRQALTEAIQKFIHMYQPHAAREDTVLFPAFHSLFTEAEFDALGDQFEEQEHKLLGGSSFEGTVEEVAQLERFFGIDELSRFTPR